MNHILLVDGSNLLFQMFFGMPGRIINSQGKAIQGTLGFVGALLKIIRVFEPSHAVVFFDGNHENSRKIIFDEYKTNRIDYNQVPNDKNPYSQINDIYSALDYMRIKYAETTVCEADDLIAGTLCTPEYIKEKFGITPEQYADFKSLTGDKSDNIKGAESNLRSQNVLSRLGFTFEAILRKRDKTHIGIEDCLYYSLLKSEWEKGRD